MERTIDEMLETVNKPRKRTVRDNLNETANVSGHRRSKTTKQPPDEITAPTAKDILQDIIAKEPTPLIKLPKAKTRHLANLAKLKLTGVSSITIKALLTRTNDPAHFRRCIKLMQAQPNLQLTDAVDQTR